MSAYRMMNCPFCDSEIRHIESLARSFDPPRVYHEWQHVEDNDCWIRRKTKAVDSATDDPDGQERVIRRWNTRASPAPSACREALEAWSLALEAAAKIAENGCLVHECGSPTEEEREICEGIASAIRVKKLSPPAAISAAQSSSGAVLVAHMTVEGIDAAFAEYRKTVTVGYVAGWNGERNAVRLGCPGWPGEFG